MVACVLTNTLVYALNGLTRSFQQLEEVQAVEQQDASNVEVFIFAIGFSNHIFERFDWHVIVQMAAVNNCGEHRDCPDNLLFCG